MDPTKEEQYRELVDARKRCRVCLGLRNPAKGRFSVFDSDHIGPWTRLDGDLDARLMVVGQEWADVRYYVENLGGDLRPNRTDVNLATLLQNVGFCGPLVRNNPARGLFLTNGILCLKRGGGKRGRKREGMQARVKEEWAEECGRRFLRSQIELVNPRVVVSMGGMAYRATLAAFQVQRPWPTLQEAVDNQDGRLLGTTTLLAVYHCSDRVLNNPKTRPWEQQLRDWQRVARALSPS